MYVSVSTAASYLGVSVSTLRRWHFEENLIPDYITPGGHRRYSIASLKDFMGVQSPTDDNVSCKKTILYSRVSSSDQREDLTRQSLRLLEFSEEKSFHNIITLEDLGSGINYKKPGLRKLLKMLLNNEVARLVIHHKDRLLRFGSELIFSICSYLGVEVVVLEESLGNSFEEELVADVIEIITVFSSKLYGKRAHANKKKRLKKRAA